MKKFLVLVFCIFCINVSVKATTGDSAAYQLREPSSERENKFQKDDDFNYGNDFKEPEGFFEKLWKWIEDKLASILNQTSYDNFWKYVFIGVIITYIILVVLKIFGKEISSVFKSNNKSIKLPYEVMHENIHEMNFDERISEAIDNHNYRLAIRFLYLKTLKMLSDHNLITWHPEKTNRSYLMEINNEMHRQKFYQLTQSFEYAWYGDLPVTESVFNNEQDRFKEFDLLI